MTISKTVKASVAYPFQTKKQIKAKLESDMAFRNEAMVVVASLDGFMSSHSANGVRVAKKIESGEPLSEEDGRLIDTIAPRYSRLLASHYRVAAIEADPSLSEIAALFSAN